MKYFFSFESEIPAGEGFSMYSREHVMFLVFAGVLALAGSLLYRKAGRKGQRRAEIIFGLVLLFLELNYNLMLILTGNMSVYILPMHLCAFSVILCILHAFTGWEWIGQFMYYLGMPGAVCALLFPDWTRYPFFNFYSLSSFIIHSMLAGAGAALLISGRVRPSLKGLFTSLGVTALLAVPVWFFNRAYNTNYMFLMVPSPGSPLEPLCALSGPELYLPAFAGLVLVILLLLYLPWGLASLIKKRKAQAF